MRLFDKLAEAMTGKVARAAREREARFDRIVADLGDKMRELSAELDKRGKPNGVRPHLANGGK